MSARIQHGKQQFVTKKLVKPIQQCDSQSVSGVELICISFKDIKKLKI